MSQSKTRGQELLENAYALKTPEDNSTYYRDFAPFYDSDFAQGLGYQLPAVVARAYLERCSETDQPVADLGCGTGLLALALPKEIQIDGLDISDEMLAVARSKSRYRDLMQLDLTQPIPAQISGYKAVLSSGTFTHGHLGPEALENALNLGAPDCLFVISINAAHFEAQGFRSGLDRLLSTGAISRPECIELPIYTKTGHDHTADTALICAFRKQA